MKRNIYNLLLTFFLLLSAHAVAQCPNDNTNVNVDMTPATVGQTVSLDCITGGQYATLNVVSGSTYTITTCATAGNLDTEITLYNNTGGASIAYNNDACGRQSTITYTATFTRTVRILVDINPCSNGTTCANLDVTLESLGGSASPCSTTNLVCGGATLNNQTTNGFGNDFSGPWGCANNPALTTGGQDRVYAVNFTPAFGQLTINFTANVGANAGTQFAEIILANSCSANMTNCLNYVQYDIQAGQFPGGGNSYTFSIPSAGTYYIIVDAQTASINNFTIAATSCENTGTSAATSCVPADGDNDGLVTTWNGATEPSFYCPPAGGATVTVCHRIYLRNLGTNGLKMLK